MTLLYRNPNTQTYRVALAGAGACVLLAELAYMAPGHRFAEHAAAGMDTVYLLAFMLGAGGAVALFVIALFAWLAAQKSDRLFGAFCHGELLADWHIAQREWQRYVTLRENDIDWSNLGGLLLSVGVAALITAVIVWINIASGLGRAVGLAVTAACAAALAWLMSWLWHYAIRQRIDGMRDHPRVLIGRDGVYCGTSFWLWSGNLSSLQAVNIVSGEPALLEFTTGTSETARTIDTALNALGMILTVAGGRGGASGIGPRQTRFRVPIPPGYLDDAAALAKALLLNPQPRSR